MANSNPYWWQIAGSAILISIGCIDPGNLIGDIEVTQKMAYKSIWVLFFSHIMLYFFQEMAIEIASTTGNDLGQQISRSYSRPATLFVWLSAELAIISADVQEILGASIALKLLLGLSELISLPIVIVIVLFVLFVQQVGQQLMELLFMVFVGLMALCFCANFFMMSPALKDLLWGFVPSVPNTMEFTAVIGAIIMPQNFFLHSSLVLTRNDLNASKDKINRILKLETAFVLMIAFFINFFIVGLFADPYYSNKDITLYNAGEHLRHFLPGLSALLWAVGLLCAGISSTATGALTGQYLMEGIFNMRISKLKRVLITRLVTLIPCAIIILYCDVNKIINLLNIVQFIELPFVIVPLLRFVGTKAIMRERVYKSNKLGILIAFSVLLQAINIFSIYGAIDMSSIEMYAIFIVLVIIQSLFMLYLAKAPINKYQSTEGFDVEVYDRNSIM